MAFESIYAVFKEETTSPLSHYNVILTFGARDNEAPAIYVPRQVAEFKFLVEQPIEVTFRQVRSSSSAHPVKVAVR